MAVIFLNLIGILMQIPKTAITQVQRLLIHTFQEITTLSKRTLTEEGLRPWQQLS